MNIRTSTGNSRHTPSKYACPHCGNKLHIPAKLPYMGTCGKCKKIWKQDTVVILNNNTDEKL